MLPNPFFCLGLALPLHPFGYALPDAHLSLCLHYKLVSPIRRLRSLPELLYIKLGLLVHPCRPHGRFLSGLNAGNVGRRLRWLHIM